MDKSHENSCENAKNPSLGRWHCNRTWGPSNRPALRDEERDSLRMTA